MKPTDKNLKYCFDGNHHVAADDMVPVFNRRGVRLRSRCLECDRKAKMYARMTPAQRDACAKV